MRVRLDVSPESKIEVITDDQERVLAVVFTPLFTGQAKTAVLAYGNAESDHGKSLDQFSLLVSGKTGTVAKKSRTKPVKAVVDMSDEERRNLQAAAEERDKGEEE